MTESSALDFARYLVEEEGENIEGEVDEEKVKQAIKVVGKLQRSLGMKIVFFRDGNDDNMKLVIGEKLQEAQTLSKVCHEIQQLQDDRLDFEQMVKVFRQAGLNKFSKETLQCCFIYLLKQSEDLMYVSKTDLHAFVTSSGKKAYDFTMTGSKFPVETDLMYSEDSEIEDEVPTN